MPYRLIEKSFPQFDPHGLSELAFYSEALGGRGEITLYIPKEAEGKEDLPLVILLHGVFGTHWAWALNGGAHVTTRQMIAEGAFPPCVLAMPSDGLWGEGTGYLPLAHANYEEWIVEDVRRCVIEQTPCLGENSLVFIAGLSMGGYGALRLGAKYPQYFAGISGLSSVTHANQMSIFVKAAPPIPEGTCDDDLDPLYWMKKNRDVLPPLRFDCGVDDKLIEYNRTLHRALQNEKIPHAFIEFPGTHSWKYWQDHLRDTLEFFAGVYVKHL